MSAALKLATVASSFGLFGASALYAMKAPAGDFSKSATALDHTAEVQDAPAVRPKLPSNFVSFTIGKYEFKNAA